MQTKARSNCLIETPKSQSPAIRNLSFPRMSLAGPGPIQSTGDGKLKTSRFFFGEESPKPGGSFGLDQCQAGCPVYGLVLLSVEGVVQGVVQVVFADGGLVEGFKWFLERGVAYSAIQTALLCHEGPCVLCCWSVHSVLLVSVVSGGCC